MEELLKLLELCKKDRGALSAPQKSYVERLAAQLGINKTCSCPDWYFDTIVVLINNHKQMSKCKYKLKAGAVLAVFGRADLATTNFNLTDDLAEMHLLLDTRKAIYFEELPLGEDKQWKGIGKDRAASLLKAFKLTDADKTTSAFDPSAKKAEPTKKAEPAKKADTPKKEEPAKKADDSSEDDAKKTEDGAEGGEGDSGEKTDLTE